MGNLMLAEAIGFALIPIVLSAKYHIGIIIRPHSFALIPIVLSAKL